MPSGTKEKPDFKTYWLLFFAILFWSSVYVTIRVALHSYKPAPLALMRYLVASIAIIPMYIKYRRKKREKLTREEKFKVFLAGIIGIGCYNLLLNYGETTTTSAIAAFIISQVPVLIALSAVIFLKEKINRLGWLGIFVSFVGIAIVMLSKTKNMHFTNEAFYILIAALCSAVYVIMQKPILRKISGIEMAAFTIWSGTLFMIFSSPQLIPEIKSASLISTLSVVYMGIFPGVISYSCWSHALTKIDASQAAAYLYVAPLITTFLGYLIGEQPIFLSLLGGFVALAGAIILHISKQWRNK